MSDSVSFGQLKRLVGRNITMEFTQRIIGIGLVAILFIASSRAQIIVQPGYGQPQYGQQGFTGSPMQIQGAVGYQQPRQLSLADEFQRNQVLQRMIENQIRQIVQGRQAQTLQQMPPGMVGLPLIHRPLRPRIGGGKVFSLTPSGVRGLHVGGYGLTRHPYVLRSTMDPQEQRGYEGRTQWRRSVSGSDFGVGSSKVHDVASIATLDDNNVNEVEDLPKPQALIAEESTDNLVEEPRNIRESDDSIVGSPLSKIHYEQPYNYDQHHPMDSPPIPSQFMKAAHTVGKMIDTVASGLTDSRSDYENKDPISSMTRHQDPTRNYQQHMQYLTSNCEEPTESPNNWSSASISSNSEPMIVQYIDNQKSQNLESSSMTNSQNSQNPNDWISENYRSSQKQPASYSTSNNPINNWQSPAQQLITSQPPYQKYYNTDYNNNNNNYQPGNQNYQSQSQNEGYRPNSIGPSSYNYKSPAYNYVTSRPISTASASAISSASNKGYHLYQRSPYNNNPFINYSPYGYFGTVDQFGQISFSQFPANTNSIVSPNNVAYLKTGKQLPRKYYFA